MEGSRIPREDHINPGSIEGRGSRGTIEERILQLQARKAKLVKALLSDETTGLRIDAETLTHLVAPPAATT